MRKTFLLVVMLCVLALSMLASPVRRGTIPHYPPCDPGEALGSDGLCYCSNPMMDCHL